MAGVPTPIPFSMFVSQPSSTVSERRELNKKLRNLPKETIESMRSPLIVSPPKPEDSRRDEAKKCILVQAVLTGRNVTAEEFMSVHHRLMKIAKDDLFKNKSDPKLFRHIIEYAVRFGSGYEGEARTRAYWVYQKCLGCEHCGCGGHVAGIPDMYLQKFKEDRRFQLTDIPHDYDSIIWHNTCNSKGRGLIGRTHYGFIPCWFNET
jgi:hypothetical protein